MKREKRKNKRCNAKQKNKREKEDCLWVSLVYSLLGEEETEVSSFPCVCRKNEHEE